jgi:hypothetical protein
MTGAEQLKGLAQTLDGFCDLWAHADVEEMRKVAVHQGDGCSRSRDGGERRWHVGTADHRSCGARRRHSA